MAWKKDRHDRHGARRKRRWEPDECDGFHLAKRFEMALQIAEIARGFLLIVAAQAWLHPKESDVLDIETRIRTERSNAVNQESGADDQHDRDRDLRDKKRGPQA